MALQNLTSTVDQRSVPSRAPAGRVGQISANQNNDVQPFLNSDPQRVQTSTLTVDTYTDGATYAFALNSIDLAYVALTADTDVSGVAAKLAALINATAGVRGQVKAVAAAAVITLTSTYPGLAFTLTESDAKLTAALVTSALQGDPMPMGRAILLSGQGEVVVESYSERLANVKGKLAKLANVTAQITHVTPTAANTTLYSLLISIRDGGSFTVSFTSDGSATVQEIVEGLVAAAPASLAAAGVTLTEDNTKVIATGGAGVIFDIVSVGAGTVAIAQAQAGDDLEALLYGVSALSDRYEMTVIGAGELVYPAEEPAAALTRGDIQVANAEALTPGAPVYVELANGDDSGKLYATSSATRYRWRRAQWMRRASTSDDLAWVTLR